MFKSERKKRIEFDKKLYNTAIVQGIFERLNELEDRIKVLENKTVLET